MCQQFDYTSIEEKEILKLYLQKKNYPSNENQNNKNHINAKKKGENNTATKPYKCNTSPTRQNKHLQMIPYNKKNNNATTTTSGRRRTRGRRSRR